MADNILEMAVRQLGSEGIGALSSALGLGEGKGESALNAGLASTIAGMLHKANDRSGLGSLLNMVTGGSNLDLSSLGEIFRNPSEMESLQKSGGNMLDNILGSKQSGVVDALSSALGLGGGTGGSLLKVAAPIVMSLLGRIVKSKGLDIGGLATLLLGQKAFIKDKIPGSVMQELGETNFDKLGEGARAFARGHAEPQAARTVVAREKKRGGFGKWFWPLLIALAALYALNMCAKRDKVEEKPGEVILEEESAIVEEQPKPETTTPDTTAGDFGQSFREYLANAARDPNREFPLEIHFGKADAQPTSASFPDVQALIKILQENPGLTIAIEGHTSSEGDEATNQRLSQERAQVVMKMLTDAGIDANRVTATGMGSAKPIGDNNTEQGREQNRRITVRVVTFQ